MKLVIPVGPKFTQLQQKEFLRNESKDSRRLIKPKLSYWELSFEEQMSTVVYDLSIMEWIAGEQVAFLFGWIRNVKFQKKVVKVILPFRDHLEKSGYYSNSKIKQLAKTYSYESGNPYFESEERIKRRERCSIFLLSVWGMMDQVGLQDSNNEFENLPEPKLFVRQEIAFHQNTHKIIPFTPFLLAADRYKMKYDHYFQNLINDNLDSTVRTGKVFELQGELQHLLKEFGCYSPFENRILSNVISQELFINSLQHSFDKSDKLHRLSECYITASLSNKWLSTRSPNFVKSFTEEKYKGALDFYKDKQIIKTKIIDHLKKTKTNTPFRKANLEQYVQDFRNVSYLDFTFIDFGNGIYKTLQEQFLIDKPLAASKYSLSTSFAKANLDSQIIEYAFLMDTSRNPLDYTIEFYALVPRGLYFLVDMIRRYRGMLIVHSGWGKVTFDFSERVMIYKNEDLVVVEVEPVHVIADAVSHELDNLSFFPGTLYHIVLPEKYQTKEYSNSTKQQTLGNGIAPVRVGDSVLSDYMYGKNTHQSQEGIYPQELFKHETYDYISILIMYNEIIESLRKSGNEIDVHQVYNKLFTAVNTAINEIQNKNTIIFFDFSGLKTGNPSWIKIIYYLLNSPKLNERTKAVIMNLPADEEQVIKDIKQNLSKKDLKKDQPYLHDPFLYRPIPCINFKLGVEIHQQIEWIGVKDIADEPLLTSMFLEQGREYSTSQFSNVANLEGSFFVRAADTLIATHSGFSSIKEAYFTLQHTAISGFLKSLLQGNEPTDTEPAKEVYLTSNGGYQYRFLSLYEPLHDKYIAKYFAKSLLDRYCNFIEREINTSNSGQTINVNNMSFDEKIAGFKFNKIVAVTVSSQLIGLAIRDLIENDPNYSFLKVNNDNDVKQAPELILLSNYYSYDKEKAFERIKKNDQVIIVNDVISTGRLVEKLIFQMTQVKQIPVCGVFSIVDFRSELPMKQGIAPTAEMDCKFFENLEKYFFTLCSSRDPEPHNRIILRKYAPPYSGSAERKRINPLLNTVVELKSKHSEQSKVLVKDLREVLNQHTIGNRFFKIGHFQQNLTHNAYIANMRPLFSDEAGEKLLGTLKLAYERTSRTTFNSAAIKISIADISEQVLSLRNRIEDLKAKDTLSQINKDLQNINLNDVIGDNNPIKEMLLPDFIFYPHFSGVEKISHTKLSRVFGTHPDNIVALQRFDTPKGWRFPFPPKRFNEITRNKQVLILDSGSLTGESLVQLIDNIGFLDVSKITVLSVVTRIDDFYREFYSRLRSFKVKTLRSKGVPDSLISERDLHEHIVPIEVLFGITLHIPVYASAVSCPFCAELEAYRMLLEATEPKPTSGVVEYIKKRRLELKCLLSNKDNLVNINYLPIDRKTKNIDAASIFYMRDLLGRIDSYRFYPEHFEDFEKIEDNLIRDSAGNFQIEDADYKTKQDIECIMICILHEPVLFDLVTSLINGLEKPITDYIRFLLFGAKKHHDVTYYLWNNYALVRLGFVIVRKDFYALENFENILALNDRDTKLILHYEYWNMLYHPKLFGNHSSVVDLMLQEFGNRMSKNTDDKNVVYHPQNFEFYRLAVNKVSFESIANYKKLDLPFKNLHSFVLKDKGEGRHFFLKQKINELYETLISTHPSIRFINQCLREVVLQFDTLLKLNIEKILQDTSLKQHVAKIYRLLSNETKGIMYYILKTESFYDEFKQRTQEDVIMLEPELNKLSDLCEKMINEAFSRESEDSFLEICQQYPCELISELTKLKTRMKGQHKLDTPDINNVSKKIYINHHQEILRTLFHQIIDNATRIHQNQPLTITVNFTVDENLGIVVIVFSQIGSKFLAGGKEGGLTHIVKHYVEQFRGSFEDNREEDHEDYEITIKLFLYDSQKITNFNETT